VPRDEIRAKVLKAATAKPLADERVFVPARSGLQRAVVITTNGRSRSRLSSEGRQRDPAGPRAFARGPSGPSYGGTRGRFSS
jgi:hypothetical protein